MRNKTVKWNTASAVWDSLYTVYDKTNNMIPTLAMLMVILPILVLLIFMKNENDAVATWMSFTAMAFFLGAIIASIIFNRSISKLMAEQQAIMDAEEDAQRRGKIILRGDSFLQFVRAAENRLSRDQVKNEVTRMALLLYDKPLESLEVTFDFCDNIFVGTEALKKLLFLVEGFDNFNTSSTTITGDFSVDELLKKQVA